MSPGTGQSDEKRKTDDSVGTAVTDPGLDRTGAVRGNVFDSLDEN